MDSKIEKFPGLFPGTIKAPLHVPSLTESSDLVCVGEVEGVRDEAEVKFLVRNEAVSFMRRVALFRVDRVEKGSFPGSKIEVEFLQTDFPSSLERLDRGDVLGLFLRW